MAGIADWAPSARLAYSLALQHGATPAQATDFAAAQYGESGFNPNAVNKSSGAAGLYQLLSSGYVNRANQLGGVLNPTANILAILPNYLSYYRANPALVPGAAAAAVEASGQPASYYAQGYQHLAGAGFPVTSQKGLSGIAPAQPAQTDTSPLLALLLTQRATLPSFQPSAPVFPSVAAAAPTAAPVASPPPALAFRTPELTFATPSLLRPLA